jgi:hypothetical protein
MAGDHLSDLAQVALIATVGVELDLGLPALGEPIDRHRRLVDADGQRLAVQQDVQPQSVFAGEFVHGVVGRRS